MSVDYIVHIWKKEYYGEDVVRSLLSNNILSKYFDFTMSNSERITMEKKIKETYGKPADVLVWDFPYFKYGKDTDLSERDREELLDAFENDPTPISLKLVYKIHNPEVREFLERYVGQNAFAYVIAW